MPVGFHNYTSHRMIGLSLKKIRHRNGMTQKALAEKLGVSRQAVCMWETGKREFKITTLNKLAKVLSVTVNEIMGKGEVRAAHTVKDGFEDLEEQQRLKV